jgi:hydrogenase maturation protein HypF
VLAPGRPASPLASGIAPGLADVGVMLPTTPLHVELFGGLDLPALVMTSGNASDEPICRGNREALERLGPIADLLLLHDRDVVRRADDSVARGGAVPFVVRRARGYVPEPLPLPVEAPAPVLALGPFLQATACLAVGGEAFVSQHVGDLDGEPARAFLEEVVDGLEEFLQARGELVVVDQHPDYPSTALGERLAAERGAPLLRVQHHLAHAAAVLAEHGAFPAPGTRAAAIALDGTGWGTDGTAWGGEWLLLDGDLAWRRLACLAPLPLVGGEAAGREPWRVLIAALAHADALELLPRTPLAGLVAGDRIGAIARLVAQPGWPLASGAGRLFEAAGALLGLAAVNGWEGEAAARLEALAASAWPAAAWPISPDPGPRIPDTCPRLPSAGLLAEAARRIVGGEPAAVVAAGFHATFCRLAVELTACVVPAGVRTVAVGGGCLVNRLLRTGLARGLAEAGYDALFPQQLPPGDGGIAYGQAVLGAVATATGADPREED